MKTDYSRQFVKSGQKITGKYKSSLQRIVIEIKKAEDLSEVKNCLKLVGFEHSYRIRFGEYRIIIRKNDNENVVVFELLLSRGNIYKKAKEMNLRKKDK